MTSDVRHTKLDVRRNIYEITDQIINEIWKGPTRNNIKIKGLLKSLERLTRAKRAALRRGN